MGKPGIWVSAPLLGSIEKAHIPEFVSFPYRYFPAAPNAIGLKKFAGIINGALGTGTSVPEVGSVQASISCCVVGTVLTNQVHKTS